MNTYKFNTFILIMESLRNLIYRLQAADASQEERMNAQMEANMRQLD